MDERQRTAIEAEIDSGLAKFCRLMREEEASEKATRARREVMWELLDRGFYLQKALREE